MDRETMRETLRANLFDGDEGGTVTMKISTLLDEVIDILSPEEEPLPLYEEDEYNGRIPYR